MSQRSSSTSSVSVAMITSVLILGAILALTNTTNAIFLTRDYSCVQLYDQFVHCLSYDQCVQNPYLANIGCDKNRVKVTPYGPVRVTKKYY